MDPAMSEMPAEPLRDIGTFLLGEKKAAKLIRVSRSLLKGSGYPLGDEIEKIAKLKSFTRARRKVTTGIAESVWRKTGTNQGGTFTDWTCRMGNPIMLPLDGNPHFKIVNTFQ